MKGGEAILLLCLGLTFIAHLNVLGDVDHKHSQGALVAIETDDDTDEDSTVESEDTDLGYDPDMELFEPTHEWKTLKPGQAVPAGLHVRLNLQTGEREAKLNDDTDGSGQAGSKKPTLEESRIQAMKEAIEEAIKEMEGEKAENLDFLVPEQAGDKNDIEYWKEGDNEGMRNTMKTDFTPEELKEALKKFKHEKDDVQSEKLREESIKKRFRTMDELKEEFGQLDLTMKTDLEILGELLERYKAEDLSLEDREDILQELEYLVHQIDNAQNFVVMGGLELVAKDLNHSSEVIRSEAAVTLGSATQSNPKVQIAAIEAGTMQHLIRMLSVEPTVKVRNRVLYALSSLIRHFPYAQQKFLESGGFQSLVNLFNKPDLHKLQVKAVTLVNDLLTEKKIVDESKDSADADKLKQYQLVPLEESINEQGWCQLLPTLLSLDDHDSREKVLGAMTTLLHNPACRTQFARVTQSTSFLLKMQEEYSILAQEELLEQWEGGSSEAEADVTTYFRDLLHTVNTVIDYLQLQKDEL